MFEVFNITVAAFQIAGGILLITVALGMLNTKKGEFSPSEGDLAIVPLAFPLTAGPGAITTVVLLTSQASGIIESIFVFIAVAIAVLVSYIALRYSHILFNHLKDDGLRVVTALMAIVVLAIAVQFIINGILQVIGQM
jgi:multiple antibiotic resistance protein